MTSSVLNKVFNKKKYIKDVSKKFSNLITFGRLRITQKDLEFTKKTKSIIEILRATIQRESTYSSGNIYFVLNEVQDYYDDMISKKDSLFQIKDKEELSKSQEPILERQSELLSSLINNFHEPVTLDNIDGILAKEENSNDQK